MKLTSNQIITQLCERYPQLIPLKENIVAAAEIIIKCYTSGGKVLVCGNGGSSADSDHIVGELMKSFDSLRPIDKNIAETLTRISVERGKFLSQKLEGGLPAISLTSQTSLMTAICNDIDASLIFAQQVIGYGKDNDVLIGLSTSGNSQNVIDACITAKAMNMKVIGFTGMTGGKMKDYCDVLVNIPEKRVPYVQELHLPVFHAICLIVEDHFYPNHK
jgi:D-sedoheptulose 7-phosphate isomerase